MKILANRLSYSTIFMTLALLTASGQIAAKGLPRPVPEFTHSDSEAWLNSKPLTQMMLRGKVVLIDFWTFDCWNCYRSFPWLVDLEERFQDRDFQVVGVHTPEFEHERQISQLVEKVERYRLRHPIMVDNDFSYWNALGSSYWPSFFVIDKKGIIRANYIGETTPGSDQAIRIERLLESLLME